MHSIIDEQSQTDYSLYCSAQINHACSPARFSGTIYTVLLAH